MTLPSLATFWFGERLGSLEIASLHSFRALGHPVTVYSYEPVANLPEDVEGRDAAEVLPTDKIAINAQKGSPALHANFFRYALLSRTDHLWVDLDLIALRPLDFGTDHVFGFENAEGSVNNAVLKLPKSSPALARLLEFTPHTRGIPPDVQGLRRVKYWLRTMGRGRPIEEWTWGSAGPKALTTFLRQTGEIRHALPVEAFYPVWIHDHARLLEPGSGPEDFGPGTYAVHLWASDMRRTLAESHEGRIPPGSFVAWAIERARADGLAA